MAVRKFGCSAMGETVGKHRIRELWITLYSFSIVGSPNRNTIQREAERRRAVCFVCHC